MSSVATLRDDGMVSKKIENLKSQTGELSNAVYTKVEELGTECQKAMEAANNNSYVATMVAFRLDSFSQMLTNFVSKLNDNGPTQDQSSISGSPGHITSEEKLLSSLLERVGKLESSSAKLEKMCASHSQTALAQEEAKQKQDELRVNVSTLEDLTVRLLQDMSDAQKQLAELPDLNRKTDDLENKFSSLQSQIDCVRNDEARLRGIFKHATSKYEALKLRVKKAEVENDTTMRFIGKKVSNLEKLRSILNKAGSRAEGGRLPDRQLCEDIERQLRIVNQSMHNRPYDHLHRTNLYGARH